MSVNRHGLLELQRVLLPIERSAAESLASLGCQGHREIGTSYQNARWRLNNKHEGIVKLQVWVCGSAFCWRHHRRSWERSAMLAHTRYKASVSRFDTSWALASHGLAAVRCLWSEGVTAFVSPRVCLFTILVLIFILEPTIMRNSSVNINSTANINSTCILCRLPKWLQVTCSRLDLPYQVSDN